MRYRHPVSLVSVAVDRLDVLAATYGNPAIEEYLSLLTESLRRCLRDVDLLYRSAEREITAILPETQSAGARLAADRFLAATQRMVFKPTLPLGRPVLPFKATSSIGVVDGPREGVKSHAELLGRLRDSIAGAQRAGGGQVFVHGSAAAAIAPAIPG
jgi:GGDEF domain-containing protein